MRYFKTVFSVIVLYLVGLAAHADNPFFERQSGMVVGTGWHGPHIVAGESGKLFIVLQNGELRRYKLNKNYSQDWTGADVIGTGWNESFVLGGKDGVFYTITRDGKLKWYGRELGRAENWKEHSGVVIGDGGWNFDRVFGGHDGLIYAVNGDELLLYKHGGDPSKGKNGWDYGEKVIGKAGWGDFVHLAASDNGRIYAVNRDGDLLFYQHNGTDWTVTEQVIGFGWHGVTRLMAAPNGWLFAQMSNGDIRQYGISKLPEQGQGMLPGSMSYDQRLLACVTKNDWPPNGCSTPPKEKVKDYWKTSDLIEADVRDVVVTLGGPAYNAMTSKYDRQFVNACNTHDLCYATPGASKSSCDGAFLGAMKSTCSPLDAECQGMATTYFGFVSQLGDESYQASQKHMKGTFCMN